MKNILKKYWSLPKRYQVAIAVVAFVVFGTFVSAVSEPSKDTGQQSTRSESTTESTDSLETTESQKATTTEAETPRPSDVTDIENDDNSANENTQEQNTDSEESSQDIVAQPAGADESYKVVDVVDGDTVKLSIDGEVETIRLIGIDTPETVHPSEPVECFGKEASNKAKELLSGKTVVLEADESQGTRDAYGRMLGYVILPDNRNFNKLMIELGYAYEYTYSTPYKYQDAFKTAEQNARTSEVGLWADGACDDWEGESEQEDQTSDSTTSEGNWYVSSHHSSKYYYCEESDGWKSLSESYLKVYESESALLADFPNHTLHESCQ